MDELTALRCRNAQLEIELRLLKEQLSHAHIGTQYIIGCLGRYHSLTAPTVDGNSSSKLQADLSFSSPSNHIDWAEFSKTTESDACLLSQSITPSPSQDISALGESSEEDLVSFDNASIESQSTRRPLQAALHPLPCSSGPTVSDKRVDSPLLPSTPDPERQEFLESLDNVPLIQLGSSEEHSFSREKSVAVIPENGSTLVYDGSMPITPIQIGSQSKAEVGQWCARCESKTKKPVLLFDKAFVNHEHNRLAGAAMFIEEMCEEEKEAHWQQLAQHGRHSAQEWKMYYEAAVRPKYLSKQSQRKNKAASRPTPADDTTSSIEPPAVQEIHTATSRQIDAVQTTADNAPDSPPSDCETLNNITSLHTRDAISTNDVRGLSIDAASNENEDLIDLGVTRDETPEPCPATRSAEARFDSEGCILSIDKQKLDSSLPQTPCEVIHPTKAGINGWGLYASRHADIEGLTVPRAPPRDGKRRQRSRGPRVAQFQDRPITYQYDNTDGRLFHTVLISNLPEYITLSDILASVRGGKIVSAKMIKTAGMKTLPPMETNCATISFLDSQSAKAFVKFCAAHGVCIVSKNRDTTVAAEVELIKRTTHPVHPNMLFRFHHGLTRILFVIDAESQWEAEQVVAEFTAEDIQPPIHAGRDADGILYFEFANARDADAAWQVVDRQHWLFNGASKGFLPDPCDRPLVKVKEEDVTVSEGTIS